jgi:hypothetical protein
MQVELAMRKASSTSGNRVRNCPSTSRSRKSPGVVLAPTRNLPTPPADTSATALAARESNVTRWTADRPFDLWHDREARVPWR